MSDDQLGPLAGRLDKRVVAAVLIDEAHPGAPVATLGTRADVARLASANIADSALLELDLRDAADGPVKLRILLASEDDLASTGAGDYILVIDDEQQNRNYFEEVLASRGYDVQVAATGDDGYRAAVRHPPALVLLDVRLPDTNGYELARLIRSEARLDEVPVLLMSNDPDLAVESRITSAGAAGFLVSPISPKRLLTAVESTMRPGIQGRSESPDGGTGLGASRQLQISLFGSPTISDHRGAYKVPHGRSSELFATLAISAPAAVATERLANLAWAEDKPATAGAVYTAMSRLRTSLQNAGFAGVIDSDLTGYRLTVAPNNIDVLEFDRCAGEALQAASNRAPTPEDLNEILQRWTGDPFQSRVDNGLTTRFAVRLSETRARLLERIAVGHLLGSVPSEATKVLTELLIDEPWRENAWALLVTALYRSGRQRDALAAFQEARSRMAHELGVDPGPVLRASELKILNHDPELLTDAWIASLHA